MSYINKTVPFYLLNPIRKNLPLCYSFRQCSGLGLEEKVVVITGAAAGIGASTAMAFAQEGSSVVIADINEDNMNKVAKFCEEQFCARTLTMRVDVTDDIQLQSMIRKTIKTFGKIDVLVNNAGILTFGSLLKADLMEAYDKTMAINLRACVYLTMLATPYLARTKGNVINISSILGRTYIGNYNYLPYCISKRALDHFMHGAALELATVGVRVNNVCPGATRTDILTNAGIDVPWEELSKSFKIDQASTPEEIADLIVYLASNKANSINGVKYYIDRGTLVMG